MKSERGEGGGGEIQEAGVYSRMSRTGGGRDPGKRRVEAGEGGERSVGWWTWGGREGIRQSKTVYKKTCQHDDETRQVRDRSEGESVQAGSRGRDTQAGQHKISQTQSILPERGRANRSKGKRHTNRTRKRKGVWEG